MGLRRSGQGSAQLRAWARAAAAISARLATLRTDRETALRGTLTADLLARPAQRITLKRHPLSRDQRSAELGRVERLADLLTERGDVAELTTRADAVHEFAAWRLVDLLVERADVAALTARADARREFAAMWLADLLAKRG